MSLFDTVPDPAPDTFPQHSPLNRDYLINGVSGGFF